MRGNSRASMHLTVYNLQPHAEISRFELAMCHATSGFAGGGGVTNFPASLCQLQEEQVAAPRQDQRTSH